MRWELGAGLKGPEMGSGRVWPPSSIEGAPITQWGNPEIRKRSCKVLSWHRWGVCVSVGLLLIEAVCVCVYSVDYNLQIERLERKLSSDDPLPLRPVPAMRVVWCMMQQLKPWAIWIFFSLLFSSAWQIRSKLSLSPFVYVLCEAFFFFLIKFKKRNRKFWHICHVHIVKLSKELHLGNLSWFHSHSCR